MMKVLSINSSDRKIITPKSTGYAATIALGGTIVSGISKNKAFRKAHKPFAYLSAVFVALHIGLMESYRYKYKKM